MKSTLVLLSLFLVQSAHAHIEPGTWMGKTDQGADCGFVATAAYFEPNVAHPLNERVKVQVGSDLFVMQHPAVVDAATATAYFNHDVFQGVLATATGARALIITMVHTPTMEGPTGFQMIDHAWKSNARQNLICRDIKHVSTR